jgi:hypothetical protein
MADDEHVEMLRKGAAARDRWRSENARAQAQHGTDDRH